MSPPPRPAFLFQAEDGSPRDAAQWGLLLRLAGAAPVTFVGDAAGAIAEGVEIAPGTFRFEIASSLGPGRLDLALAADGWVRAELRSGDGLVLRAWIEDPYEEKQGWPDGADGVGEGPMRLSKRGTWLSIDCARFPGVPADEHGLFQIEDAAP
jgi:hypothetical protein